ncbi:Potassium transport protein [Fusarium oxysporum f. sp. albedinis]|nr:Potassium transport protein [Fusarium oxysporum f. sp. albedinis]
MSYPNYEEESVADEFERWQSTKQDTFSKHDYPLEYWSAKRFEYPRVAKMAIDVLSVPAMAAECERAFSSAGSMVSPQRTRLDASTIAVTQTVRSWLKAGLLEGYDGLPKETSGEVAGVVT